MWSLSIQYLQKCLLIFLIIAKNVYSFPSIMSEKYNLAFLLTRDDSSKIDWPIDMEVPEYKKHMLQAFTVFLISLIGFKNF